MKEFIEKRYLEIEEEYMKTEDTNTVKRILKGERVAYTEMYAELLHVSYGEAAYILHHLFLGRTASEGELGLL